MSIQLGSPRILRASRISWAAQSLTLHEWPTSWHPPSGSPCSFLLLHGETQEHPWSTSLGTWQPYHIHNQHLKWLVQWGACHGISGIPCMWFLKRACVKRTRENACIDSVDINTIELITFHTNLCQQCWHEYNWTYYIPYRLVSTVST